MRTLWTYFALIRLQNCLIASIAVAVGQYLSPSSQMLPLNHFAMAAAFFVCGFGNIVNDILDLKSDAINHPDRALPSARITIGSAKVLAGLFLLISLILSCFLNVPGLVIVTFSLIALTVYNVWLKHTSFGGNIVVSLLGGLAFIFGGTTSGLEGLTEVPGAIIPGIFAFLMHFGREVIKDIQDFDGDRAVGSGTAPVKAGTGISLTVAYVTTVVLIAFGFLVYFQGWFSAVFLYISIPVIYAPLIGQLFWLGFKPGSDKCCRVSSLIKLEMLPGIIALLIGKNY